MINLKKIYLKAEKDLIKQKIIPLMNKGYDERCKRFF